MAAMSVCSDGGRTREIYDSICAFMGSQISTITPCRGAPHAMHHLLGRRR